MNRPKNQPRMPDNRSDFDLAYAWMPKEPLETFRELGELPPTQKLAETRDRLSRALTAGLQLDLARIPSINRILNDLANQKIDTFSEKAKWVEELKQLCIGFELVVVSGTPKVPAGTVVSIALENPSNQYPEGRFIVGQTTGNQASIRRVALPDLRVRCLGQP